MKHKRGHKQLAKVAQWVNWVVAIAICIYAVLFFIVASQASGAFSGSTEIIVGALLAWRLSPWTARKPLNPRRPRKPSLPQLMKHDPQGSHLWSGLD